MRTHKGLGDDDGGGGTVARGAALELGERVVDLGRGEDLVERVNVAELRVGIVGAVAVVLLGDLGKVHLGGVVLLHVLAAGVAEHLRRRRSGSEATEVAHGHHVLVERVGAVLELGTEAATLHLLEPEREHALGNAALHELLGDQQRRAAGAAVVVDIVDRNASEAEAVHGTLAASRVAIHVAHDGLLHVVVRDASVVESLGSSLGRHLGIVPITLAGFLEAGHTDTDHKHTTRHGGEEVRGEREGRGRQGSAHAMGVME